MHTRSIEAELEKFKVIQLDCGDSHFVSSIVYQLLIQNTYVILTLRGGGGGYRLYWAVDSLICLFVCLSLYSEFAHLAAIALRLQRSHDESVLLRGEDMV